MSALREVLATFDIIVNDTQLDAADKKLDSFVDKLKDMAKAFAAFKVVKSIIEFGEATRDAARAVEFNAARMEMGTDEYQRLSQVASNYGMTMEQLQIANTLFTRTLMRSGGVMGEFGGNTKQAQAAMRTLGLDAHQFRGQKLEQILPVVSDAMLKIKDPMERLGVGILLFGHRGRAILPMMAQGGEELRRQFAAAIPVFEEATIKSADRAALSAKGLSRAWDNLIVNSFGKALMNAMTWVTDRLTILVQWLKEMSKYSEIGKGVLAAFGIAAAVAAGLVLAAWWPVLVPILAILAAFAALALIIDDLIVFMEGGDSLTGELIDKFFGKGAAEKTRKFLEDLWDDFKNFFAKMQDKGFHEFLDGVTEFAHDLRQAFTDIKDAIAWIETHWKAMTEGFDKFAHFFGGGSHDLNPTKTVEDALNGEPGKSPFQVDPSNPPPMLAGAALGEGTSMIGGLALPSAYALNFNNPIDAAELGRKVKHTVDQHINDKVDGIMRDALGAVGGSK